MMASIRSIISSLSSWLEVKRFEVRISDFSFCIWEIDLEQSFVRFKNRVALSSSNSLLILNLPSWPE